MCASLFRIGCMVAPLMVATTLRAEDQQRAPSPDSSPALVMPPQLTPLGSLERESVEEALAAMGLALDPNPDGKLIAKVYVVNQEVFSRRDWHFHLLNVFHRTTRPEILRRELLLSPGQRWDGSLAEESVRNLQVTPPLYFADGTRFGPPQLSSVVALVPVASPIPGTVDLLAVTRDLWSLRFNTDFEFQKDTLSLLETSISENNLFGWRKQFSAGFKLDQGRYGFGPTYYDPNIAGTRLVLLLQATVWYGRSSNRYEGNEELLSFRYPLYALASRWGGALDIGHNDAVVRHFCDNQLCPAQTDGGSVPFIFRYRTFLVDANAVRSFGRTIIQRLTAGYRLRRHRSLPESPAYPSSLADDFLTRWAPLSEIRSEPYLRYELFTPRYGVFRDLDTFDLRENRRLGPLLAVEVGAGLPALGADFAALPMSATASWAGAPGASGFAVAQVQASARARSGQLIDQRLSALLYLASPMLARAGRLVVAATTDAIRADTSRAPLFLGGDNGLRGYQIGEFRGAVTFAAHAEIRSAPIAVYSQRFGAVLFYDVGHAAGSFADLVPHHDFGIGVRWLIPQLNASVVRIDWTIPTQEGPYTNPGLPGRITAGFMQSFWLLDSPKGYLPTY